MNIQSINSTNNFKNNYKNNPQSINFEGFILEETAAQQQKKIIPYAKLLVEELTRFIQSKPFINIKGGGCKNIPVEEAKHSCLRVEWLIKNLQDSNMEILLFPGEALQLKHVRDDFLQYPNGVHFENNFEPYVRGVVGESKTGKWVAESNEVWWNSTPS